MGIFDKFHRRGSESAADPDVLGELRSHVRVWVHPGFTPRDEVLAAAQEYRDGAEWALTDRQVELLVDGVWQARLAEQSAWPEQTDADRVAAAFAELDAGGVVARMNFTCCQTCGVAEIDDERPADRVSTGYVFFHQQDSERLGDEPAHLFLAYGTLDPIRGQVAEQDEEVGRRVETALRAQGLPVEWTGSSQQRISVGPITWQRRLPTAG
ncbi:hypothetical protein [Kribbella sp. NPDC006257]|uniref:DUF6891 domain-containing protein n=1 Tax=Kribbella sp. NPDC006257 TaxID=3156738 RepID=UPI0033B4D187